MYLISSIEAFAGPLLGLLIMNVFIVYNVRKSNKAFSNMKTKGNDRMKPEVWCGDEDIND